MPTPGASRVLGEVSMVTMTTAINGGLAVEVHAWPMVARPGDCTWDVGRS